MTKLSQICDWNTLFHIICHHAIERHYVNWYLTKRRVWQIDLFWLFKLFNTDCFVLCGSTPPLCFHKTARKKKHQIFSLTVSSNLAPSGIGIRCGMWLWDDCAPLSMAHANIVRVQHLCFSISANRLSLCALTRRYNPSQQRCQTICHQHLATSS